MATDKKKMSLDELKQAPAVKQMSEADKKKRAEGRKKLLDAKNNSAKALNNWTSENEIAIQGECLNKAGDKTKVLVVDTDAEGYIGLFLEIGNPYALTPEGQMDENGPKLLKYLGLMSNIDLLDTTNQKAVGFAAIQKARAIVSDFFIYNLVSQLNVESETDD